MDFTVKKYKQLLTALKSSNYVFQTMEEFLISPAERSVILRHDVDDLPQNSLIFAKIQAENGIKGVYYFRAVRKSWDEGIIKEIGSLGHEVGYHYENLTTCKGNIKEGIKDFQKNLTALRKLQPVSTICMHGSPLSKYDSKDLWKHYDYKDYKVIGEPYFDVDFKKVFYLTDTGRTWNGSKFSVRDKVNTPFNLTYFSTLQIIESLKRNNLPEKIMFTFHPQRWNDNFLMWIRELILQNVKNIIKKFFYVKINRGQN